MAVGLDAIKINESLLNSDEWTHIFLSDIAAFQKYSVVSIEFRIDVLIYSY